MQTPTCKTKITGENSNVENLKDYLQNHDDHPNVEVFLENCELKTTYLPRYDLLNKFIDLCKKERNNPQTEFTTRQLYMTLGEDQDLNKRFYSILPGSCFHTVTINCNSVSIRFFDYYLKNYCHILDVLDFQNKVSVLTLDHAALTPIHADLLNGFHNLGELISKINEVDLENVKSRILELVQLFKQAKFKQLHTFRYFENSFFGYAKDLIPAWTDFLTAIPSKSLQRFQIICKMDQVQNQSTTQFESANNLSLPDGIARFARLQFLTTHRASFDSTLIKILLPLRQLKNLDLRLHMDISNKNEIEELCHNLENCNRLEEITINVPIEMILLFGNMFVSLAKVQRFRTMNLYFDSLEKIPADEYFKELELVKNLRKVNLRIKRRVFNGTNDFYEANKQLKEKFVKFVSRQCNIEFFYYD